jgi:hypothetical protein
MWWRNWRVGIGSSSRLWLRGFWLCGREWSARLWSRFRRCRRWWRERGARFGNDEPLSAPLAQEGKMRQCGKHLAQSITVRAMEPDHLRTHFRDPISACVARPHSSRFCRPAGLPQAAVTAWFIRSACARDNTVSVGRWERLLALGVFIIVALAVTNGMLHHRRTFPPDSQPALQ